MKKSAAESGAMKGKSYGHFVHSSTTAARLAEQHGVDERTIRRDGQFAKAIESVKQIEPDIERKVTLKQAPAKAAVVLAAKLLEKEPERAKDVLSGRKTIPHVSVALAVLN